MNLRFALSGFDPADHAQRTTCPPGTQAKCSCPRGLANVSSSRNAESTHMDREDRGREKTRSARHKIRRHVASSSEEGGGPRLDLLRATFAGGLTVAERNPGPKIPTTPCFSRRCGV